MKKSKILEILKVKLREGKDRKLYYITLKLENGEEITLGKKKEDAFSVGQEVSYTETMDSNGKKKWSEPKKSYASAGGMSNRQVAVLGACIIASQGRVKFEEAFDIVLKQLEA